MAPLVVLPPTGFMASIVCRYVSRPMDFMFVVLLATRFVIYLPYDSSVRLDWLKIKVEDN